MATDEPLCLRPLLSQDLRGPRCRAQAPRTEFSSSLRGHGPHQGQWSCPSPQEPPALFFSDPTPSGGTPRVERGQPTGPTNSCERNLSLSSTPPGPPLPPVQNEELERDGPRPVKCHSSKRPFKSVWFHSSTSQTRLIPRRVQPPTQRALRETSYLPARGLDVAARGCRSRSPTGRTVTSR